MSRKKRVEEWTNLTATVPMDFAIFIRQKAKQDRRSVSQTMRILMEAALKAEPNEQKI